MERQKCYIGQRVCIPHINKHGIIAEVGEYGVIVRVDGDSIGCDCSFAMVEPEEESNTEKLSMEQLERVADIIGDGWKVYGIEEYSQCLNFDGPLYVSDILKAADYIRSITQKQKSL